MAEEQVLTALPALAARPEETIWIVSVVRYLLGRASNASPRPGVDPEQVKHQIFLALRFLFERRLHQGPVVLVVEDLHRADAASVELLQFIVEAQLLFPCYDGLATLHLGLDDMAGAEDLHAEGPASLRAGGRRTGFARRATVSRVTRSH